MYKHYIRLDINNNIIYTFSDAFEQPNTGDIFVGENEERHFNPNLLYNDVIYRWKFVNGQMIEMGEDELKLLWSDYQVKFPTEPSEIEKLKTENTAMKKKVDRAEEIAISTSEDVQSFMDFYFNQ